MSKQTLTIDILKFLRATRLSILSALLMLSGIFIQGISAQPAGNVNPIGEEINAKKFYSSAVDEDNTVWFLSDAGIVSFDGTKWSLHNKNRKVSSTDLKDVVYDFSSYGPELWLATPQGATVVSVPVDARSGATTYYSENSEIISENVLAVAVGKKELRWFGTDRGISAFKGRKWLTNNYARKYPEGMFKDFPITAMATSVDGDSVYVATMGGGVFRLYRNDVDAVSGASDYAGWGPILIPSDNVFCVHISSDGTQWFGTDMGVGKHAGFNTLEGWEVFTTVEGLADDVVKAINSDTKGNMYFGTKNGFSVFDGKTWTTYRTDSGLVSNNILTITVDRAGAVWLGTDSGVSCYKKGEFTSYQ
jgi:ligand-binding sensor domain-containing protein